MDQIFDFQNVENDEPEFQRNHSIVKITIYIKTIAGNSLDFVVPETETVESLKAKIEEARVAAKEQSQKEKKVLSEIVNQIIEYFINIIEMIPFSRIRIAWSIR